MSIDNYRDQIDKLNAEILALLNQRAKYAQKIGEIKLKQNLPIYDKEREEKIFQHLFKLNKGPLSEESIRRIFRTIIEENRNLQTQHLLDDEEED